MISQIELITAILTAIEKKGQKNISVRQYNAVVKAATEVMDALRKDDVLSEEGMGLQAWLASDDVGLSSKYMASVIHGVEAGYAHPHDPSDFGRCYRMIRAIPGTREKISMLSVKSKYWELLIENWDLLENLYERQLEEKKEGFYPCYDKMKDLEEEARKLETQGE